MACPAKDKNTVEILTKDLPDLPIQEHRLLVCSKCDRNINGICRPVAAQYGKDKAVIKSGIKRFSLSCPKGKWPAIKIICPSCDRAIIVSERVGVCNWCQIKNNMGRANRNMTPDDGRDHRVISDPFKSTPIKNLHYFIYPKYEDSVDYHIEELQRSIHIFNGKKICCVAIDQNTLQDKYVLKLEYLFDEVYYVQNNSETRESAGFIETLKKLRSKDPNQAICFAHAKGQQIHTKTSPLIRLWSETMYETCVRNWSEVQKAMEDGHPVVGSFKSFAGFRTTKYQWHYSGSFWWARSKEIFSNKNWQQMCNQWWAAESYVGRHYTREEGYCLFGHNVGSLYEHGTWERLKPQLELWRTEQNVLS